MSEHSSANPQPRDDDEGAPSEDLELLRKAQDFLRLPRDGEVPAELADAWGEFYLRYDAILWQFAGQFPLATEAADALVMQTWEQILINFPDFDLAAPGLHA